MFLLFEDEWGTVNVIVPKLVYERHRHLARAEPLLLARGRLERAEGVVNVIVSELAALERFLAGGLEQDDDQAGGARVHRLRPLPAAPAGQAHGGDAGEELPDEDESAGAIGASMRAAAPAVQSFAAGRRR